MNLETISECNYCHNSHFGSRPYSTSRGFERWVISVRLEKCGHGSKSLSDANSDPFQLLGRGEAAGSQAVGSGRGRWRGALAPGVGTVLTDGGTWFEACGGSILLDGQGPARCLMEAFYYALIFRAVHNLPTF